MQTIVFALVVSMVITMTAAFSPARFSSKVSNTRVYEDFDTNWQSPNIISDKQIFSEKQLREFTETYSVDYRMNPLEFFSSLGSLFKGGDNTQPEMAGASSISSSLKKTISIQLLQSKTADYVSGKINANAFKAVLNAAFGDKLPDVIDEINANLPAKKKI